MTAEYIEVLDGIGSETYKAFCATLTLSPNPSRNPTPTSTRTRTRTPTQNPTPTPKQAHFALGPLAPKLARVHLLALVALVRWLHPLAEPAGLRRL